MTARPPPYSASDFPHSPLIVFYETTRACDLCCRHCRANAQRRCHPDELSSPQATQLVDQMLQFPKPPMLVLTGGDPMKRPDIFELIDYAVARRLVVSMTPSATPLVTSESIARLKGAGLHRLAVSLDGADSSTHDRFRRIEGSFEHTLWIIREAHRTGLSVQVNTTVARHIVHQINAMADLLRELHIVMWSVFFLVPTGRATAGQCISAHEAEAVFAQLAALSCIETYAIKTTEAPHYRRHLLTRGKSPGRIVGTNDGRGVMFVSHVGEIFPSGFLPIDCGRFPADSIVHTYQQAQLFKSLRDPKQLKGKCGVCDFQEICGGSRARAYALTGDPLAPEPHCSFIPDRWVQPAALPC